MDKLLKVITVLVAITGAGNAFALPPMGGRVFGISPITNEISFYGNIDDSGNGRGRTIQIVAINSVRIGIEFNFEFTADFNWNMSCEKRDHYIELSLVKPFWNRFSVNYQRIISTFECKPVNQFGIRLSF
jgi:hypothetical protein